MTRLVECPKEERNSVQRRKRKDAAKPSSAVEKVGTQNPRIFAFSSRAESETAASLVAFGRLDFVKILRSPRRFPDYLIRSPRKLNRDS